jgi:hypothetical protein
MRRGADGDMRRSFEAFVCDSALSSCCRRVAFSSHLICPPPQLHQVPFAHQLLLAVAVPQRRTRHRVVPAPPARERGGGGRRDGGGYSSAPKAHMSCAGSARSRL